MHQQNIKQGNKMSELKNHPVDKILEDALQLAKKMRQSRVMPFHLLTTIVDNQEASEFLAARGFPVDNLRAGVDRLFPQFKQIDIVADLSSSFSRHGGYMSYDARTVRIGKQARSMVDTHNTASPGYLELLCFLEMGGDREAMTAIKDYANIPHEEIIKLMVQNNNNATAAQPLLANDAPESASHPDDPDFRSSRKKIIHLDKALKKNVIGQDKAIEAVHEALKRNVAGLKEPDKPLGSFLFPGPTGVGKTELAKQLAEELGVELVRIDMSEYMEKHTIARLIGAPPGYVGFDEGGLLSETVGKHNKCVLLLDEMDKAHPDVFNILLQVMDNGELTSKGKKVDFRNTILIMTSNDGAGVETKHGIGFHPQSENEDTIGNAVNARYTPEFRNRLDGVIQFDPISKEDMVKIAAIIAERLNTLAAAKTYDLSFKVLPETLEAIVDMGYDPKMGARPIKRVIDKQIKNVLAEFILEQDLSDADIVIGHNGHDFTFETKPHALAQRPENDNSAIDSQHFVPEDHNHLQTAAL